ncbi:hypothetical protein BGX21_004362 [Mortierella sp. AD011]|nr:hypothetical protein BGX20_009880 [Mortierella sp. AD010]KAF9373673.1 hypothetical protein BGX21_004362 [Mortierella sp. AD011]
MSEIKVFTTSDLSDHKSRDSLYLAIGGNVYDCTKFIDEHPGGEEVLLDEAEKDATEAFEDVGHSEEARELLKDMLVGKYKADDSAKKAKAAAPKAASASASSDAGRLVSWVKGFF